VQQPRSLRLAEQMPPALLVWLDNVLEIEVQSASSVAGVDGVQKLVRNT